MSTLRCTNLQDTSGGNSLTTAQIYNGAAKAWVNFNGSGAVAVRANFNVNSITDNGTGDYTVNFSSALSSSDYVILAMGNTQSGSHDCAIGVRGESNNVPTTKTTSACRLICTNQQASSIDPSNISVAVNI